MNRKQLMEALRKAGLPASITDLAGIKKWAEENGHDIQGTDGKSIDLDAAWNTKTVMKVEAPAPVETKTADEIEAETKAAQATAAAAEKRLKDARRIEAAIVHADGRAPAIGNTKHAFARKSYELKIKSGKAYYKDIDEAEQAGAFFRLAFAAIKGWDYSERENDLAIVGKTSTTVSNASAGVLVPDQYSAQVMWLTEQYGMARKTANVQMFSGTDNWKRPRKTGILAMNHLAENGQMTGQDNTYDLVSLTPKKVGAIMFVSNELMDDAAVSVADEFTKAVAEAQAYREDLDYFIGDGSATYGGHVGLVAFGTPGGLPSGASLAAAGGTWTSITLANVANLQAKVENVNPARCKWRCSRQFYFGVLKPLALAAGGTLANEILGLKGLTDGADFVFLGDPGSFVQVMPRVTAASTVSLLYGDFEGGSMLGIHTELRIAQSGDLKFDYDAQAFRAISRIAVNPHGDGRGSTYGPIVGLATTA